MCLRGEVLRERGLDVAAATDALRTLLEPVRGGACEVRVVYRRGGAEVGLRLGAGWRIRPGDAFVRQAQRLVGSDALAFRFRAAPAKAQATAPAMDFAHSG